MSESRLPIHPYAELSPALTFAEFAGLSGAIGREGLLEAITLHEGKILDGQQRYLACLSRQVAPRLRDYAGECGSALEFVVSKNIRRHLTDGQRAWVAAKLRPHFVRRQPSFPFVLPPLKMLPGSAQQGSEIPVGLSSGRRQKPVQNELSTQQGSEIPVGLNSGQRDKSEQMNFRPQQASEIPVGLNSGQRQEPLQMNFRPSKRARCSGRSAVREGTEPYDEGTVYREGTRRDSLPRRLATSHLGIKWVCTHPEGEVIMRLEVMASSANRRDIRPIHFPSRFGQTGKCSGKDFRAKSKISPAWHLIKQ
jgi:hypothetical protein